MLQENTVERGEIAQNEQFHLLPQRFLCNLYLKSFNSHILVVVCSFFEFGTVSKWCFREWVKMLKKKKTKKLRVQKFFSPEKKSFRSCTSG